MTISDSTIPMGPMFSLVFSLRNIHISKVTIGSVLLSSRTVCDMVIDKVDGNMQTFLGGSSAVNFLSNSHISGVTAYTNFSLLNSQLPLRPQSKSLPTSQSCSPNSVRLCSS